MSNGKTPTPTAAAQGEHGSQSEEEADLLRRSKKRNKGNASGDEAREEGWKAANKNATEETEDMMEVGEGSRPTSYRDAAIGVQAKERRGILAEDLEGYISDDDVIEISTDESWIGVGMTKEETREA